MNNFDWFKNFHQIMSFEIVKIHNSNNSNSPKGSRYGHTLCLYENSKKEKNIYLFGGMFKFLTN